jgi:hypothetical protein
MDLQDIKKEIASLDFESSKEEKKNTNEFTFLGFNKIKIGIMAVVSFLVVYLLKPSFILNIYYNPSTSQIVKKIKYGKYILTSLVTFVILLFAANKMFH